MLEHVRDRGRLFFLVLVESGQIFGEQRISRMAAAVAYRGIFALAPLMLIAVAVFGFVIGDSEAAQDQILELIADIAGQQVADGVRIFVESAAASGGATAIVGFVLLLWTTSSLFYELQNDLNDIFEVPYEHTSGLIAYARKRGLGFLWTMGFALIGVAVWALNLIWGAFEGFFDDRGIGIVHSVIEVVAPLVTLLVFPLVIGLVITTLTQVSVNKAALYVGSFFTTVVFLAAAVGVRIYFSWDSETTASTVAGSLFVILLTAFALAAVFLLGAVVTKQYHDYYETGPVRAVPPPVAASFRSFLDGRRRSS